MSQQENWFTKQLEIASQRADALPAWARREAGLPTTGVSAPAPKTEGGPSTSQSAPAQEPNPQK